MCVLTTRAGAERSVLCPLLVLRSWAVAGVAAEVMGIGPVCASAAALDRVGLTLADMDVLEVNEALAAQILAVLREWKVDSDDGRLNPTAPPSPSATPSGRPARGSWPPWSTKCSAAEAATASGRCALAEARVSPPHSRRFADDTSLRRRAPDRRIRPAPVHMNAR